MTWTLATCTPALPGLLCMSKETMWVKQFPGVRYLLSELLRALWPRPTPAYLLTLASPSLTFGLPIKLEVSD